MLCMLLCMLCTVLVWYVVWLHRHMQVVWAGYMCHGAVMFIHVEPPTSCKPAKEFTTLSQNHTLAADHLPHSHVHYARATLRTGESIQIKVLLKDLAASRALIFVRQRRFLDCIWKSRFHILAGFCVCRRAHSQSCLVVVVVVGWLVGFKSKTCAHT